MVEGQQQFSPECRKEEEDTSFGKGSVATTADYWLVEEGSHFPEANADGKRHILCDRGTCGPPGVS